MQKKKKKIDELTLVLIVALLAIIISIFSVKKDTRGNAAEKITEMLLDDHEISITNNGIVDENRIKELQQIDYEKFKSYLNTKSDFCIYIEDNLGNILLAKGSEKLSRDGLHCKE